MGLLAALELAGRAQLIAADFFTLLRGYISLGMPIGALSGELTGLVWARTAWRSDEVDWWLAGAVAGTAFGIGLAVAGVWGFMYPADADIGTRINLAVLVILGALPMVVVAFSAALAWIGLMHLAAKMTKRSS